MKSVGLVLLMSCVPLPGLAQSMTTAAEVRPILAATKASWVAVRRYDGQDLLYFTQLESWRCGLDRIGYAINGGKIQAYETEPCHEDSASPNAITAEGHLPYLVFPEGSIESVTIQLLFDDGGKDGAVFERQQIEMN